ncbi:hypothetical protein [Flavobacterium silvaticum]|uniref:Uncharacterized protein n=1 Tax=Flavobacterium silvaticum TaxID=1852020 RepID=A0A972FT83_9FLAO|nr:hypothetical protein [Flavobacterium silvaticum]NMH28058.1 hypothetical protein [Flavobacterium silvaticum]
MNAKHILYLVFPFAVGFVAQMFMKIPDTSYWFYIWLLCLASVFIFVKMILPYQEQKFNAINSIDYKGAMDEKNREEKPYTYIVGLHMVVFVGLIILYFTN